MTDPLDLPHHERIEDTVFRRGVDLIDAGNVEALRAYLNAHPGLIEKRVTFEEGNYFRNPTLLEFIAENPVRRGKLPENIVEIAKVILDAGAPVSAVNETLGLVATGRVARECNVQTQLINLLCDHGADPNGAIEAAALHQEMESVEALIARGARITLPIAAALGQMGQARQLLPSADGRDRQLALSLAAQFGRVEMVRLLLDAGVNPDQFNTAGHSHTTPLHQAALAGHEEVVRLLVERGARLDLEDKNWHGTPAGWASHAGRPELAEYLQNQQLARRAR
ncbi:MAG: ankyrin repeat domain-containing protein [Acidobacteriaceae bacterium]|nr:ankyrin repeat domain-containing protein [Acidobacteriaceae bacterium]